LPGFDTELGNELDLLVEVVREAGALCLHWLAAGARTWDKSPGNPVTEADIAVNDLIALRLGAARPGYGWLSEETRDDLSNRSAQRIFVVDPIDGTRAFMRGDPGFCVSIALLDRNRPVAGVLFNPMTDELLAARAGAGAALNGQPIRASAATAVGESRMIGQPSVFSKSVRAAHWPGMVLLDPLPNAIAWRIALVAAGRCDAAVALNSKNDWDLAAAVLILAEAGGVATDRNGDAFVFNGSSLVKAGVVAAGAGLHPLLLESLGKLGRQP